MCDLCFILLSGLPTFIVGGSHYSTAGEVTGQVGCECLPISHWGSLIVVILCKPTYFTF